jgi:16S rRNA (guanine1207-N2)-methyltransferase
MNENNWQLSDTGCQFLNYRAMKIIQVFLIPEEIHIYNNDMHDVKPIDYAKFRRIDAVIAGKPVTFTSKPGVEDWERVRPAEFLIANLVSFRPGENVLLFGCRHGASPAVLALGNPYVMFTCVVSNWISIQCIHQTVTSSQIDNLHIHQYPVEPKLKEESSQKAILLIPKGRSLARRWLLEAYSALEPGGVLYICGANDAGVQSIIKDANDLFTHNEVLGYKKGERIARLSEKRDEELFPDWTRSSGIVPGTWMEFDSTIGGHDYLIRSLPGIFSYEHLDEGTSFLLANIKIPEDARVLDLGCGYGIIGMVAARMQKTALVDMVDVDLMGVASSIQNIHLNALDNAQAFASDLLSTCSENSYQLILSNPPFHAGKETNHIISSAMIEQAYNSLAPGGEFTLVANRFLRYEKQMENYFSKVSIKAQTNKYHIITGVR